MALFETEAILLGSGNGVPLYRAAELLERALQTSPSKYTAQAMHSALATTTRPYLNNIGFRLAASYRNVEEIRKELEPEVRSA